MKRGSRQILIINVIFWLMSTFFNASAQQKITLELNNADFDILREVLEKEFPCSFTYVIEDVEGALFTLNKSDVTLQEVLTLCEQQSNLKFNIGPKGRRVNVVLKEMIKYTGVVYESGTMIPLPGAALKLKNSQTGTITGKDGSFNIMAYLGSIIEVSFIGYHPTKIKVENSTSNSNKFIFLTPSTLNLDEVIVVAYGEQSSKSVKGSIEKILAKELIKVNSTSFEQKLQGKVSGLQVLSSSGESASPVRMLVRGVNSISAGVNPLIVLDGVPLNNDQLGLERSLLSNAQNPLSLLNPNDIASIEVLKDAASTTLYGSRASNGIILITSKSGKSGPKGFEFSYNTGISSVPEVEEKLGLSNTSKWFSIIDKARENSGLEIFNPNLLINIFPFTNKETITRQEALATQTNWFDEVTQTGISQDFQLSYKEANDKGSLYISGNYRNENGVLINDNFERFSIRTNIDFKPSNNLTSKIRSTLSYTNKNRPINETVSSIDENLKGGFSHAISSSLPWFPIYSDINKSGYWNSAIGANIVASYDENLFSDDVKQYRYSGSLYVKYSLPFLKGLSIKGLAGTDLIYNNNNSRVSEFLRENLSFASLQKVNASLLSYNIFGEYEKQIKDHQIVLLGGIDAQRSKQDINLIIAEGISNLNGQDNLGNFGGNVTFAQDEIVNERYLFSYLARANYQFKDKFFAETSYRLDATSAFSPSNRWSSFSSFSTAWIISQESFFNVGFIDYLKLKASYGKTGNQEVADNLFVTNFRNDRRYGDINLINGGTSIQSLGVRDLSWETSHSFDVGFEYSLFKDRYYGSFTYFQQHVSDLLLQVPLPYSATIDDSSPEIWENTGGLQNQGFEIELGVNVLKDNDLSWDVSINYTHVGNKVNNLYASVDNDGGGIISRRITLTKSGGVLGGYYLAAFAGVDDEKGVEMIQEIDLDVFSQTGNTVKTGNLIPATQANIINHRVLNHNKSGIPTFYGGINSTLRFRQFTLDMNWTFVGGHYLFDSNYHLSHYPSLGFRNLQEDLLNNSWSPSANNAQYAELKWDYLYDWNMVNGEWVAENTNYNNSTYFTDRFLQKGDFIRLKNIRLNYSFKLDQLEKIKLNALDVYFSAQNILTFTNFKGLDPEVATISSDESINNLSSGFITDTPLPNLPTFNLGIIASF